MDGWMDGSEHYLSSQRTNSRFTSWRTTGDSGRDRLKKIWFVRKCSGRSIDLAGDLTSFCQKKGLDECESDGHEGLGLEKLGWHSIINSRLGSGMLPLLCR